MFKEMTFAKQLDFMKKNMLSSNDKYKWWLKKQIKKAQILVKIYDNLFNTKNWKLRCDIRGLNLIVLFLENDFWAPPPLLILYKCKTLI